MEEEVDARTGWWRNTHHRDVEFVQVAPRLRLRLDYLDLFEGKRAPVPNIRQHGSRLRAQAAILPSEEGYPAGLKQPTGDTHGVKCNEPLRDGVTGAFEC